MPVKRRKPKAIDDFPRPWDERPVSRERWERHRERLLAWESPGRRPEEWWEYEAPKPRSRDRDVAQCRQLYEMGELTDAELAKLMPQWRHEYERSHEPSFFYPLGPGQFLEGAPARRALYRWAGIPRELIKQGDAERARRTRAVRRLQEGSVRQERASASKSSSLYLENDCEGCERHNSRL